jgi:hypothetical protein
MLAGTQVPDKARVFFSTLLKIVISLPTFQFSLFSVYIPFFLPEHCFFSGFFGIWI